MTYTEEERVELCRIAYNERAHILDRIEALCDLILGADDDEVRKVWVLEIQHVCWRDRMSHI